MKRRMALLLLVVMLLSLCACGGQSGKYGDLVEELASAAPSVEATGMAQSEEPKRTLTLAFRGYNSLWYPLVNHAKAYMAEHPDVVIEVELFDYGEYTREEFNSEMSVRLMAGEGPDLLGWWPDVKMLQSGQFLDLYPYMENDPDFHEEDYYMDILTGLEVEGELTALTMDFSFPNCYAMRSDLEPELAEWFETAESVTYADMINLYETLTPQVEGLMPYETFLPTDALLYYADVAMDVENQKCSFMIPELADLLERSWGFPTVGVTVAPEGGTKYSTAGGSEVYQRLVDPEGRVLFRWGAVSTNTGDLFDDEGKVFTMPRLIRTAGGQNLYSVYECLSITRTCEDPELAWDFIRFCIKDKEKPYDHLEYWENNGAYAWSVATFCSVNRDNNARLLRLQAEEYYYSAASIGQLKHVGDREKALNDAVNYALALVDQLDACETLYGTGDTWPEQYLFLTGETTAEEFLAAVQNKVNLYIKE